MIGTINEADIYEVVLVWLEGLEGNVIIRPTLISGELRVVSWNTGKESIEVVAVEYKL